MLVLSRNYGLTRKQDPWLDATKHVEAAMARLCSPEEIHEARFRIVQLSDPKRKSAKLN